MLLVALQLLNLYSSYLVVSWILHLRRITNLFLLLLEVGEIIVD
jgi:hypothetical protein